MPKITHPDYLAFKEKGLIETASFDDLNGFLDNLEHDDLPQARALLIILFYSGRRPAELMLLKPKDVVKENQRLKVVFPTVKGGMSSTLFFPFNDHIKEFFKYAKANPPMLKMFYSFETHNLNKVRWQNSKGKQEKVYFKTSSMVNYWVKKWTGKPAYWFRHNRLSYMAEKGATDRELMQFKGAKDYKSISPYLHLSTDTAKRMSNKYFK